MARRHALFIASLLGLAAVIGVVALGNTLSLGVASHKTQNAVIAKRTRQLDRFEASLRKQLAASKATPAVQTTPAPAAKAQRVVYVRPQPIVVHKHRAGGEYEGAEHEGGGLDD
jgi:hypothetical protein